MSSSHDQSELGVKKDPSWAYLEPTHIKGTNICKFCKEPISGGVYRMKFHLAKIPGKDVRICPTVDIDVQRQISAYLDTLSEKKETRKRTQAQMARPQSFPSPSPPGAATSLQTTAPRFPPTNVQEEGSASASGPSAGASSAMRCDFFASRGGQTTLDAAWYKDKFIEARKAVGNFWYYSDIPFNVANSPYWPYMVQAIAACGPGFKAPSYHDLRGPILDDAVLDIKKVIEEQRKIWKKKGCSILSDGWNDRVGRDLLNFLVSSSGGLVFLKSVDASGQRKTGEFLFGKLQEIIEFVGAENVVQVVTDNAAAYVSAGRMIEDEYPTIAWTPCAAHVLDLLLEDIGKTAWIKSIVEKAKNITKFIYNHSWVLHLMRTDFTEGRDLIRPGITRFATSFLSLQSVHNKRAALKQMFVCDKWMESRYAREPDGMNVVNVIFDDNYWIAASQIIKITEPLVKVLRVVDSDKASMGYLYEAMDRAKETIQSFYIYDAARFRHIWDMIDRRWNGQLHRPLHAAGLYLNPKFFYADTFDPSNGEINQGLHRAIKRLVPDVNTRRIILNKEIQDYKKAQGYLFSSPECVDARTCLAPDLWWEDYGGSTPNLQKVAIKILSQVCSSAGCERNWSTFEHIHSKKRSRLTQERLNDLVFVHYNLRLRHRLIEGTSNEAIELDEIDATEPWSSWLRDVPEEVQDFDFTSQDVDRLEEEAIAMAEEEERAREEVQRAREEGVETQPEVGDPSHSQEEEESDEEPLIRATIRARAAKERSRRGKQKQYGH